MSQTYIDHFKSTFSYVPALSFNEWAMNMGINNDTSDILYANSSTGSSNSNRRVNCEEEKVEGKKNCKKKKLVQTRSCRAGKFLEAFIQRNRNI